MGLDIFFYKAKEYKENREEAKSIGYLRKCNVVYGYAQNELGINEDECTSIFNHSELVDLKERCLRVQEILKDGFTDEAIEKVEEILPTQEGFFFGSTDYDEYYLTQVEETLEVVEKILDTITEEEKVVVYFWY